MLALAAFGEIFGGSLSPRGLGWLVFPFVAGAAGARLARAVTSEHVTRAVGSTRNMRLIGARFVSWWLVVLAFLWIAQPYGSYAPIENAFDDLRLASTMRWMFGPPILVIAILAIFRSTLRSSPGGQKRSAEQTPRL